MVRPVPTLDIVLVNWNTGPVLGRSVAAIAEAAADPRILVEGIWVVDNSSSDRSWDIGELPSGNLRVIRNADNVGFARACNQGARAGSAQFILFINPDVCVRPDTLAVSVSALDDATDRGYGIAGIRLVDPKGLPMPSVARFPEARWLVGRCFGLDRIFKRWFPPHFLTDEEIERADQVDQVIGAYFLVRRNSYEQLGGFDEEFFVYFEDLDFSLRARRAGIRTLLVPGAAAVHLGGVSSNQTIAERTFYSLRSRVLYSYKHFGIREADLVLAVALVGEPMARMARAIASLHFVRVREAALGSKMLWRAMPELLRARSSARTRAHRAE